MQPDSMLNAQKLLVVGPSWIGDMVMAQSLFKLLKRREPEIRIDVLAPAWSEALLARMPEVHSSITMPAGVRAVIAWYEHGGIQYIPFPESLVGSYQSYTCADISGLRKLGYSNQFVNIDEGVRRYLDFQASGSRHPVA